ncbi:MAG: ABC transporter ATP-binding protein [Gammaproteobacteria bacterium]
MYSQTQLYPGPVASFAGVYKRYGNVHALDGLDLEVRPGELLAILGPNGAGKSTAISLLLGLQEPSQGKVAIFGESPRVMDARRKLGVMMQEVALAPDMRVRELIDITSSYYADPMPMHEVLDLTQTTALAKKQYGKLSGGQKRLAQFAMAICGRPRLLFLDEPTVGLDVQARERMWFTLRELVKGGTSIVLTTHYLEEAEALADRVVVLGKGRVVASGTVNEIRSIVARKKISCITSLEPHDVRQWSGVEEARREHQRLEITVTHAEKIVRRLLVTDSDLTELEVSRAGLAEAFNELTQETAQ